MTNCYIVQAQRPTAGGGDIYFTRDSRLNENFLRDSRLTKIFSLLPSTFVVRRVLLFILSIRNVAPFNFQQIFFVTILYHGVELHSSCLPIVPTVCHQSCRYQHFCQLWVWCSQRSDHQPCKRVGGLQTSADWSLFLCCCRWMWIYCYVISTNVVRRLFYLSRSTKFKCEILSHRLNVKPVVT